MNIKTNIGAKFLRLLDSHFPPGSTFHPLLNRKKMKLSYCCLPNFKSAISKHNFKILNQKTEATPLVVTAASPRTAPYQESALQKVLYTELL